MVTIENELTTSPASTLAMIERVRGAILSRTFTPHRFWRGGHRQTVAAYLARRRKALESAHAADETRLFQTESDSQVLAHCRWQKSPANHPTLILVHGLEGSSISVYMLGTSFKAYAAGFNVVRLNMRNCGATEHLTPTLYDSGMTGDLRFVIDNFIKHENLSRIFIAGFSMGGNVVLKLAGELGRDAPDELAGCCAVSPSLDLTACAAAIEHPSNRIYQSRFVGSLHNRMRRKHELFPQVYDINNLKIVRTVRDFDERFTAPHGGYKTADDYYEQASALRVASRIQIPTLIITAQDDPFVPYKSFTDCAITDNAHIILHAPTHGGHVGFLADKPEANGSVTSDRFWAEHRIVEFCTLVNNVRRDIRT